MGDAYDLLDSIATGAANRVVESWNWTTGGTKTDLANKLLFTAPIFETVGFGTIHPVAGAIMGTILLCQSDARQRENIEQLKKEQRAKESGAIDSSILEDRRKHHQQGGAFGVFSAMYMQKCIAASRLPQEEVTDFNLNMIAGSGFIAAGHGIRSASHYVMLADDLPPRKNCVRRGIEYLSEVGKQIGEQLSPKPAFEYGRLY